MSSTRARWAGAGHGLIAAALLSMPARAQSPFHGNGPRAVVAGAEAFMLLPPELIAAPRVTEWASSSDGRYVLALRDDYRISAASASDLVGRPQPAPGSLHLILWDGRLHESSEVWS